jgi:hypothetical protein
MEITNHNRTTVGATLVVTRSLVTTLKIIKGMAQRRIITILEIRLDNPEHADPQKPDRL